jgi:hypothetical protein
MTTATEEKYKKEKDENGEEIVKSSFSMSKPLFFSAMEKAKETGFVRGARKEVNLSGYFSHLVSKDIGYGKVLMPKKRKEDRDG